MRSSWRRALRGHQRARQLDHARIGLRTAPPDREEFERLFGGRITNGVTAVPRQVDNVAALYRFALFVDGNNACSAENDEGFLFIVRVRSRRLIGTDAGDGAAPKRIGDVRP